MSTVDYLPVATGGGANVDTQGAFAGSGYQTNGFLAGLAISKQLNKCWRQSSMMAAALANFISIQLGINVLDDGNLANLITNLTAAITSIAAGAVAPTVTVVAYSATPAFACPSRQVVNFQITLTGNVTVPTFTGALPGMIVNYIIKQDGVGGRTFAWPAAVPGSIIDPGANQVSTQGFLVDAGGTLHPYTPMTVS